MTPPRPVVGPRPFGPVSGTRPRRIGEYLLEQGRIRQDQLDECLLEQDACHDNHDKLGDILVRNRCCSRSDVVNALNVLAPHKLHDEAIIQDLIPTSVLVELGIVLLTVTPSLIHYATMPGLVDESLDVAAQLRRYVPGEIELVEIEDIELKDFSRRLKAQEKQVSINSVDIQQELNPTTILRHVLERAIYQRASDVYFLARPHCISVAFRIDGVNQTFTKISNTGTLARALFTTLKVRSKMDIARFNIPQDGSFRIDIAGRNVDIRSAYQPEVKGDDFVLRILDADVSLMPLERLGMPPKILASWKKLVSLASGMIIITGAMGHGKSTTLISTILNVMDFLKRKVTTIENPVEYHIPGITQVEVSDLMTFDGQVKSFLRQAIDVCVVGEIRDQASMDAALQLCATGTLVIATMHVSDVETTMTRIKSWGIDEDRVYKVLHGIMCQRLVRMLCKQCQGAGCPACRNTGYFGRIGHFEYANLQRLRKLGLFHRVFNDEMGEDKPYYTFHQDALRLIRAGITDAKEIERVSVDVESQMHPSDESDQDTEESGREEGFPAGPGRMAARLADTSPGGSGSLLADAMDAEFLEKIATAAEDDLGRDEEDADIELFPSDDGGDFFTARDAFGEDVGPAAPDGGDAGKDLSGPPRVLHGRAWKHDPFMGRDELEDVAGPPTPDGDGSGKESPDVQGDRPGDTDPDDFQGSPGKCGMTPDHDMTAGAVHASDTPGAPGDLSEGGEPSVLEGAAAGSREDPMPEGPDAGLHDRFAPAGAASGPDMSSVIGQALGGMDQGEGPDCWFHCVEEEFEVPGGGFGMETIFDEASQADPGDREDAWPLQASESLIVERVLDVVLDLSLPAVQPCDPVVTSAPAEDGPKPVVRRNFNVILDMDDFPLSLDGEMSENLAPAPGLSDLPDANLSDIPQDGPERPALHVILDTNDFPCPLTGEDVEGSASALDPPDLPDMSDMSDASLPDTSGNGPEGSAPRPAKAVFNLRAAALKAAKMRPVPEEAARSERPQDPVRALVRASFRIRPPRPMDEAEAKALVERMSAMAPEASSQTSAVQEGRVAMARRAVNIRKAGRKAVAARDSMPEVPATEPVAQAADRAPYAEDGVKVRKVVSPGMSLSRLAAIRNTRLAAAVPAEGGDG
jgi:general secretion pathway protein E